MQLMKENDPRLVEIANWRNHATENEHTWIRYIWAWHRRNVFEPMHMLKLQQDMFSEDCKTGEIFTTVTSWSEGLSEDEKRVVEERQGESDEMVKRGEVIDPGTGKPFVVEPDPVGPFLDEHGDFRNAPRLSGISRKKIIEILPTVAKLWEQGLLDAFLNHPRLKQCPVCKVWFVVSKTNQKFCQTRTSDRPVNPHTLKPRPPCRILAYQRTEEYKEKTRKKMANWRVAKKAKEREAQTSRKARLGTSKS
jgi:hypothetical protein